MDYFEDLKKNFAKFKDERDKALNDVMDYLTTEKPDLTTIDDKICLLAKLCYNIDNEVEYYIDAVRTSEKEE
jgi:hypothetical protein